MINLQILQIISVVKFIILTVPLPVRFVWSGASLFNPPRKEILHLIHWLTIHSTTSSAGKYQTDLHWNRCVVKRRMRCARKSTESCQNRFIRKSSQFKTIEITHPDSSESWPKNHLTILAKIATLILLLHTSYKMTKCDCILEDIESVEEQKEILINYHEGKTNHRGILETYQKLKQKYYWPNLYNDVHKHK